jgi:hypothetical protein
MIEPATSRSVHHMLRPYPSGVACPGAPSGCIAERRQRQDGEQRGEPHRLRLPEPGACCLPARKYRTTGREIGSYVSADETRGSSSKDVSLGPGVR